MSYDTVEATTYLFAGFCFGYLLYTLFSGTPPDFTDYPRKYGYMGGVIDTHAWTTQSEYEHLYLKLDGAGTPVGNQPMVSGQ